MKKNLILSLLVFFLFTFCKSKPQLLPEISDYLKLEDYTQIDFNHNIKKSFVNNNEVLFLTKNNELFILDLVKKKIKELNMNIINHKIKKILFFNNRIVVFSDKGKSFLFIREKNRIIDFSYNNKIRIYFDLGGILLYSINKNLVLFDYYKYRVIKSLKLRSKILTANKIDRGFVVFERNSALFFQDMRLIKEIKIPYELKSEVLIDKN